MNTTDSAEIRPFTIDVPQADLDDLQARLERTRFAPAAPGDSWEYGTPESYLREMVDHWRTGFDWRAQESPDERLPELPSPRSTGRPSTSSTSGRRSRGRAPSFSRTPTRARSPSSST